MGRICFRIDFLNYSRIVSRQALAPLSRSARAPERVATDPQLELYPVQRFELAQLAEVDHAEGFCALDGSLGGLDFAAQEAEQGGFAAAVGADEADFHAGGEDEVEAGEKQAGFRG